MRLQIYDRKANSKLGLALSPGFHGHQVVLPPTLEEIRRSSSLDLFGTVVLPALDTFACIVGELSKNRLPYWSLVDEEVIALFRDHRFQLVPEGLSGWSDVPLRFHSDQFFPAPPLRGYAFSWHSPNKIGMKTIPNSETHITMSGMIGEAVFEQMSTEERELLIYIIHWVELDKAIRAADSAAEYRNLTLARYGIFL